MACEECRKRAADEKRSLSDCKGECEKLNAKAQKLSIAVAVLGTVLGKETLDMALGLESTLSQIASTSEPSGDAFAGTSFPSTPPSSPKAPDAKPSGPTYMSASVDRENTLLSYVPPLTTFKWEEPDLSLVTSEYDSSFGEAMIVPFRNGLFLFGLAFLGHQKRRRDG